MFVYQSIGIELVSAIFYLKSIGTGLVGISASLLNIIKQYIASVPCSSLTDPNNGLINCSLGDDGVPSYEDTCSFACNTGYELTGSDTRTCQSDGSWSGSEAICTSGQFN